MTLGEYRNLSRMLFGPDSEATQFLENKIAEQGENEEVIQHESQMIMLLMSLDQGSK